MSPQERMEAQLAALGERVRVLEAGLERLQGHGKGEAHGDQALIAQLADEMGVAYQLLLSGSRGQEVCAVRRIVALALRERFGWSAARTGRALRISERSVRKMATRA